MKRINNLDTTSTVLKDEDIEILADKSLSELTSSESVLSHPITIADIVCPNKINIHIRGYVYYYGGYAEHTRNVVLNIAKNPRYNIKLSPIASTNNLDPSVCEKINIYCRNKDFDIHSSIFLGIAGPGWFQNGERFIPQDGRYKIGWTMIETLGVQPRIMEWLNNLDEVWCPTVTDMRRFEKHRNTILMHLGYDEEKYNENTKPANISNLKDKYVFGIHGSWNKRKGVRTIIRAFLRGFYNNHSTALVFVGRYGTRPFDEAVGHCKQVMPRLAGNLKEWTIGKELRDIIDECVDEFGLDKKKLPQISVLDVPLHDNILPHISNRFDCLVGMSAGESTWLPGLQFMAMGKPIIQLNAESNGFMEYLHDVGILCNEVKYNLADKEDYLGTSSYYEGELLAQGNEEELIEKMKIVRENNFSTEISKRLQTGLIKAKDWTWKKAISSVDERLQFLYSR